MVLLFDPNITDQAYRTKERLCPRGCGVLIYFEARYDKDGNMITKDGKMPNGIFGKENNVKWFWREALSKNEHLYNGECRKQLMSRDDPISEKQAALLAKHGVDTKGMKKGEASDQISKILGGSSTNRGQAPNTKIDNFKGIPDLANFKSEYLSKEDLETWIHICKKSFEMHIVAKSVGKEYPEVSEGAESGMVENHARESWNISKRS